MVSNKGEFTIIFLLTQIMYFTPKLARIPEWMFPINKIHGGKYAETPIPWQVEIFGVYKDDFELPQYPERFNEQHFCGGTILDEYTILTACHCWLKVDGTPQWPDAKRFFVMAGKNAHSM